MKLVGIVIVNVIYIYIFYLGVQKLKRGENKKE